MSKTRTPSSLLTAKTAAASRKKLRNREGSSLLIALIIMGILLTLALGISELLIGTLRDNRLLLERTKAWYAAESGIERALLSISINPPGYEEEKEGELSEAEAKYAYGISAAETSVPHREPYEIQIEADTYNELAVGEAITIPLFKGTDPDDGVQEFRADFYLSPTLRLRNGYISSDLDILRWKIFGIATDGSGATEVINEFVPEDPGSSAESPTCIGTSVECYNGATFFQRILGSDGAEEYNVIEAYPIREFLRTHKQNFLVLTNFVNVNLISGGGLTSAEKKQLATIRYRIRESQGVARLTSPIVEIRSDGTVAETTQSIDIKFGRERFLPVFNYALYGTSN
ncbi:hypothetical protein CO046_04465 [Candidatus Peregrinibacteria bacterium CG_4_9_14_0_2_um_filter_53_11]|nr:MAG: hypothetical protein CO046_04465 [Candidatus Peregrinibacteria bacterium CG_4_9_14_0_2_um_filter_53_11]